jgi:hypothetical protein
MAVWTTIRIVSMLLAVAGGCGPDAAQESSNDGSGSGSATAHDGTATTGSTAGTLCGADGMASGTVTVRADDEAARLAGCSVIMGDLLIDPCRVCLDSSDCIDCGPADALTTLGGLESLEYVSGSVIIGWDDDLEENKERSGHTELDSLAQLDGLREIGGDLHLGHAPAVTTASFAGLERIGGRLLVSDSFPVDVELRELRSVGRLEMRGPSRQALALPLLERAEGVIFWATRIEEVRLPSFAELSGDLLVRDDPRISDLSPLLNASGLGHVTVFGLPRITALDITTASAATGIYVSNCAALERVSIPGSVDSITTLTLEQNPSLTDLELESVVEVGYDVMIFDNESLASLAGLASLQHVAGSIGIGFNPQLCASEVEAFVAGIEADDGIWSIEGNADC